MLSSFPPSVAFVFFPSTQTVYSLYSFNLQSSKHKGMIKVGLAPQNPIHLCQQPCLPFSIVLITLLLHH